MKNRTKLICLPALAVLLAFAAAGQADSPITSTPFHEAYLDVPMVRKAKDLSVMTEEMAHLLADNKTPLDIRVAAVNALSWDFEGKKNAQLFSQFVYKKPLDKLKMDEISAENLLIIGYLQALDNYFQPQKALPYLEKAKAKKPKSFTTAIIWAVVKAQIAMDTDWCQVWKVAEMVLGDPSLTQDPLRPEAKKIIEDYLRLYADECH